MSDLIHVNSHMAGDVPHLFFTYKRKHHILFTFRDRIEDQTASQGPFQPIPLRTPSAL